MKQAVLPFVAFMSHTGSSNQICAASTKCGLSNASNNSVSRRSSISPAYRTCNRRLARTVAAVLLCNDALLALVSPCGYSTFMNKLRFGICGLGCMGRSHFARLFRHPRAAVVALCDQDERRRRGDWNDALGNFDVVRTASGHVDLSGLAVYATPEELIADSNVDAVLVTLPTLLHDSVATAALSAGKHVLCEKPMALNPAGCNRMIAAARRSGQTLMIAQCLRFWPQYVKIKELIDAGRIGAVRFAVLRRQAAAPTYSLGNWLLDARQSGGAILDLHVHDVDFAHYLFGVPDQVYARGMVGPSGGIDHVLATHSYLDGRYVLLEGGWVFHAPWQFDMAITIHGDQGTLHWRMSEGNDVLLYSGNADPERFACQGDALLTELDYFIEVVTSGQQPLRCAPVSTRLSVILSWLERRSIETGRAVPISEQLKAAWADPSRAADL